MNDVIIIGASAHGRIAADIALAAGINIRGFIDDAKPVDEKIDGIDVLGGIAVAENYPDCDFVIAIGSREIRQRLATMPLNWTTLIHPSAVVSRTAKIGKGCIVMPLAVINAAASVGDFCMVKSGAVVEYETKIGSFCNIATNSVCGASCNIGDNTQISIGATIRNSINICNDVTVGAGAVVIRDIRESGAYVGVPAKRLD